MELCYDESLVYLKTFGKNLNIDGESFFKIAMDFKITKQMCKELDKIYKEEGDPHNVIFDATAKKWFMPQDETILHDAPIKSTALNTFEIKKSSLPQDLAEDKDLFSPSNQNNNAIKKIGSKVKNLF